MAKNINFNIEEDSQFAILGLGKFGASVAKELARHNKNVLCCDKNERIVQSISNHIDHVINADATSDEFLEKVGIGNFDVVILSFTSNFEDTVLATVKLKELNVPLIIAKATDERHKQVLEKIGADVVLLPEVIMGERLAHSLIHNDPLMQIYESEHFEIEQISPQKKWLNKALSELHLPKKEHINVLGIIRDDELLDRIGPESMILENDILVVIRNLTSRNH